VKEFTLMLQSFVCGLFVLTGSLSAAEGIIEGIVVNGSRERVAGGVDVVLRAPIGGEFVVVAEAATHADGSFRFANLPLDAVGPYLPGANLGEVHFPGPRVSLDAERPRKSVTLIVYEAAESPSPLVVEEHNIVVSTERGAVHVRETMLISNPSTRCYVGRPRHEGGGPVTLQMSIPSDFERVTFDKEGFGRQFRLINGKLVTGMPWPPGKRALAFSYVVGNQQEDRVWQRRTDLPSLKVHLSVRGHALEHVTCNLPAATSRETRVPGTASFESRETRVPGTVKFESPGRLPAGYVIELELDRLPVPLMASARRVAVVLLVTLVVTVTVVSCRYRRNAPRVPRVSKTFGGTHQFSRTNSRKLSVPPTNSSEVLKKTHIE
jgi:hypothetical protein